MTGNSDDQARDTARDRELGMSADISRRDFMNGVGVAIGASLLPPGAAAEPGAQDLPGYYPPALQGMRGSHPGSFEAAHLARDGARWDAEDLIRNLRGKKTRDELSRMLGPGGFDAARDIAGITVNRWPHGYAYSHDPESGEVAFQPSTWPAHKRVWALGSRTFGNIAIAGTDAASNAMTESAIEEAHRAVSELI